MPGGVDVLRRPALEPTSLVAEPLRSFVRDLAGGNVEAEVVEADGVTVVKGRRGRRIASPAGLADQDRARSHRLLGPDLGR
jgi:hypothetical protein